MSTKWRAFCRCLAVGGLLLAATGAQAQTTDWSVATLDKILAAIAPGQRLAQVGDMEILVSDLQTWRDRLTGGPVPNLAFDGTAPTWTGGNVYYTFDGSVSAPHQKVFLDGAQEWATFANLHLIPRSSQANYITIQEAAGLEGGQSAVGMVGGQQFVSIGPTAWNRPTVCHEIGHALGLVHEHQRSDRDSFVAVFTNNILGGQEGNFVLLPNSRNQGAYDFLSIMHYSRNALSSNPALDTLEPLPAYQQYLNIMGQQFDPVLSALDRAGMAAIYGAGPPLSSVVTNTLDSGPGSLRAALYYAFDHPGTTIRFNIPTNDPGFASRVFTIQPTDRFPSLVNATTLDGTTQTNFNPSGPAVQLNGALAPPPSVFPDGLRLGGTNCTVRSLVINGFPGSGILIDGPGAVSNAVTGCYLGLDPTGTVPVTNGYSPITIDNGAHGNTVGGATPAARNTLPGSYYQGVVIRDTGTVSNRVMGNYIGLNAAGTAAVSNRWSGVAIYNGAAFNTIGGASAALRNIISGNGLQGLTISDATTTGNAVQGNYIGLNPAGTAAIPNGWAGVDIFGGAVSNLIGGTVAGDGNVISGNSLQGIAISQPGTHGNVVAGNHIGANPAGNAAISNGWSGVQIFNSAQSNIIGGSVAGSANLISGNGNAGVMIDDAGTGNNAVQGNYIGLNVAGTAALGNAWAGVELWGGTTGNLIGGPNAGNIISGNGNQGVIIVDPGTAGNVVGGNFIGLDPTGAYAISNAWAGVDIFNGAQSNLVGGGVGARNVIAGNGNSGVALSGGVSGTIVRGNTIGLNAAANAAIPNLFAGVVLFAGAVSNQVGDTTLGGANLIADNLSDGVQLFDDTTTNNSVRGNSLFGNAGLGIALYNSANLSAAAPLLSNALFTTNLTLTGQLASLPSTLFHLDFYASPPPLNTAQAQTYLGTRDVVTGTDGTVNFSATLGVFVPIGQIITAAATDPAGNTSPLSAGVAVTAVDSVHDGIPDAWRAAHFGGNGATTNSLSCALCDPDHDGLNNLMEFLAGTDPNSAASTLKLGTVTESGADIIVSFQSVTGIVYRLWVRDALVSGGWSVLADQIPGTGGLIRITDPGAAAFPKAFYRVQVMP